MTRRSEPPFWITAVPFLGCMVSFLVMAIESVFIHRWLWTAICVVGILTSALSWYNNAILRDRIRLAKQKEVRDAYEIVNLKAALKRERSWRN